MRLALANCSKSERVKIETNDLLLLKPGLSVSLR